MKIEATNARGYVRHLEALETLNQTRPHGPAVTLTPEEFGKLVRIERKANRDAVALCNGEIEQEEFEKREERHLAKVRALLGHPLPGLFVNGDPRGYALKIDPERQPLPEGMHTDWGSYGIIAPQF